MILLFQADEPTQNSQGSVGSPLLGKQGLLSLLSLQPPWGRWKCSRTGTTGSFLKAKEPRVLTLSVPCSWDSVWQKLLCCPESQQLMWMCALRAGEFISLLIVKIQQKDHLKREKKPHKSSIFLCKDSFLHVLRRGIAMGVIHTI